MWNNVFCFNIIILFIPYVVNHSGDAPYSFFFVYELQLTLGNTYRRRVKAWYYKCFFLLALYPDRGQSTWIGTESELICTKLHDCVNLSVSSLMCYYVRFFVNLSESEWICTKLHESALFCVYLYGSAWICTNLRELIPNRSGSVWIWVNMYEAAWFCANLSVCLWICFNMYNTLWICPNLSGSVLNCVNKYKSVLFCKMQHDSVWLGLCMNLYQPVWISTHYYSGNIQVTLEKHIGDTHEAWGNPQETHRTWKFHKTYF